ncbi:hypothetical protein [Enterococcus casseliflavus]|uniref:hypothetical protein n=1 Tax=Enterococcus casseliflavus TaxID=37734 RepID=UPI0022E803EE|nr:hypothetical protein [Enterococcus casseliflavus]
MEKVVFIDRSTLAGSLIKIFARNIQLLSEDQISVTVVTPERLANYRFAQEKLVLVDPLLSLTDPMIKQAIPPRIKRLSFPVNHYSEMNTEAILELIQQA